MRGQTMSAKKTNLEFFISVHPRMHLACTDPFLGPWHWISIFSTELGFPMRGQIMPVGKKKRNSKQSWMCMKTAPFEHGPMHARGSVRARLKKLFLYSWQSRSWHRKYKISWKKLNSILRGPCKGLCTQGACVRVRLKSFQIFLVNWQSLFWHR